MACLSNKSPSEQRNKHIENLSTKITKINKEQEEIKNEINSILENMDNIIESEFNKETSEHDYILYSGTDLSFSTPINTKEFTQSDAEDSLIEKVTIHADVSCYDVEVIFFDKLAMHNNKYSLNFSFNSCRFGECKRVELLYNDFDESSNRGYANRLIEWHRTDDEFYDDDNGYYEHCY